MNFRHPTTEVKLEGIYIVKNKFRHVYVYLSSNINEVVVTTNHEFILKYIEDYDLSFIEDDFTYIGNGNAEIFLDA